MKYDWGVTEPGTVFVVVVRFVVTVIVEVVNQVSVVTIEDGVRLFSC